jgi:hypothetical protein
MAFIHYKFVIHVTGTHVIHYKLDRHIFNELHYTYAMPYTFEHI